MRYQIKAVIRTQKKSGLDAARTDLLLTATVAGGTAAGYPAILAGYVHGELVEAMKEAIEKLRFDGFVLGTSVAG